MTVIVHRKSIEELGTTTTKKGEEPVWKVQFELSYEGTNKFSLPLSFDIVGPAGATQTEEQRTKNFGFSSRRQRPRSPNRRACKRKTFSNLAPAWRELQLFTRYLSEPT